MPLNQYDIFLEFGLSKKEASVIGDRFKLKHFAPYETVLTQGELSDNFYYIGSGELIVLYEDAMGNEVVQNVLTDGQFFGEIGLLQNMPRSATVKALTNVQLFQLFKADFDDLLHTNESFASLLDETRIERQLSLIPTFRNLKRSSLAKIRGLAREVEISKGDVICKEGDYAEKIYFITTGRCELTQLINGVKTDSGVRKNGDFYDHEVLLNKKNYAHTVTAIEDSKLLVLDMAELKELVKIDPPLAANLPKESGLLKERTLAQKILPFLHDKAAYQLIPAFAMNRPKHILYSMLMVCFALLFTAAIPSIWPDQFPLFNHLKIDTDPENMLPADEPARVFHNKSRKMMDLYDVMVIGIVNKKHEDGIYNVNSLKRVHEITEFAKTLRWQDVHSNEQIGVVTNEMMSLSTVDNIEQAGAGSISFSWLMRGPPTTKEQAIVLRSKLKKLPILQGLLASEDDQAIALYLPLTSKEVSFRVYTQLREFVEKYKDGDDEFYVAGLPVAEDAFGVEMFIQMAISAPLAMLAIFAMMYFFFRNLTLITAPMIIAMVSVICTMSLLVISGQTIHIMSSMIAIFVMPIAVLDSVHILSEFFDFYPRIKDRRLTMIHVMSELFVPMFYTSVTTAIGFASLALVPIPPVQVFGIFVAIGVIIAWLLSISFIPAYIMLVNYKKIDSLITDNEQKNNQDELTILSVGLHKTRKFALDHAKFVVTGFILLSTLFIYGISVIEVNDNPVRWFQKDHYLSISDREMNDHFAGTYLAYISLEVDAEDAKNKILNKWSERLNILQRQYNVSNEILQSLDTSAEYIKTTQWFDNIENYIEFQMDSEDINSSDNIEQFLQKSLDYLDVLREQQQAFKQPEMLTYIDRLQADLEEMQVVGKSLSLGNLVKMVNRELHSGESESYRIPDTSRAVAQTLLTYQSSHRPQDIWHYTTHDYQRGVVSLMLKSGDNIDMNLVIDRVNDFVAKNPPPQSLKVDWFGLNYINVVWQEKMVSGMLLSIIGSYFAVLFIMTILLRSYKWGLLSMVPLTMTLLLIYGMLGILGKYYDMPVAVLSALAIGLSVDFAVHFLIRIRHYQNQCDDWKTSLKLFFGEPAQAFIRNVLVITLGFTPLLLASLVPYNTVGILIAAIMLVAGAVSLVVFSSFFQIAHKQLFNRQDVRRISILDCKSILFAATVFLILSVVSLKGLINYDGDMIWFYAGLFFVIGIVALKKCAAIQANKLSSRTIRR